MLQSLPPGDPNPKAYPIEDAPHGATVAYPNLGSVKTLAREQALAKRLGIRPAEVFDYPDEEVSKRVAAGQVTIDPAGRVTGWDHLSGHYRPDERQAREVAAGYFTLSGLRSSGSGDQER